MVKQFGRKSFVLGIALFVFIGMVGCADEDRQNDLTGPAGSSEDLSQAASSFFGNVPMNSSDSEDSGSDETPEDSSPGVPDEAPAGALVFESLKNGQTTGFYEDARFTADGLLLENGDGYLEYSIPTTPNGYVEFNAKGFEQDEYYGGGEFKSALFTMWDGNTAYHYENAAYFYELRKFGHIQGRPDASNALDLRVSTRTGQWHHGHRTVLRWDPNQTYRFRIEWGYGSTTVYRDGAPITSATVSPDFTPGNHMIGIGANLRSVMPSRRREAPHNIVISDVVIATR